MVRLRVVGRLAITRNVDSSGFFKSSLAVLLSLSLLIAPVWGASSSPIATVVFSNRASVGTAAASVGTTLFGGDRLSTDDVGSVQVRAGAARLRLSSSSSAVLTKDDSTPAATLTMGTATFSTANSKAFALHVASAVIRPRTDQPTVGQVTVLNPKELVVRSNRGSLTVAVDDDVREIPEGAAFRIVLDPAQPADPQGPRGAGSKGQGGPPIKAAKSKFIWYAIGITAVLTWIGVDEALESPDRP